ncbi:hypothetical protein HDU88_002536 [Geranomyces variabilis]|nr:hypothetical protein HDU88_002536 [Geranomyces variabilis]
MSRNIQPFSKDSPSVDAAEKRAIISLYLNLRPGLDPEAAAPLFEIFDGDVLGVLGPHRAFNEAIAETQNASDVSLTKIALCAYLGQFFRPQVLQFITDKVDEGIIGRMSNAQWAMFYSSFPASTAPRLSYAQAAAASTFAAEPQEASACAVSMGSSINVRKEVSADLAGLTRMARELEEDSDLVTLYHATLRTHMAVILGRGILLSRGARHSEFAVDGAFYTSPNLEFALRWSSRFREETVILVFRVPKTLFAGPTFFSFQGSGKDWQEATQSASELKPYSQSYTQYGIVKQEVATAFVQYWCETWINNFEM